MNICVDVVRSMPHRMHQFLLMAGSVMATIWLSRCSVASLASHVGQDQSKTSDHCPQNQYRCHS